MERSVKSQREFSNTLQAMRAAIVKSEVNAKGLDEVRKVQQAQYAHMDLHEAQANTLSSDIADVKTLQQELTQTAVVLKEELKADRIRAQVEAKADRDAVDERMERMLTRMGFGTPSPTLPPPPVTTDSTRMSRRIGPHLNPWM